MCEEIFTFVTGTDYLSSRFPSSKLVRSKSKCLEYVDHGAHQENVIGVTTFVTSTEFTDDSRFSVSNLDGGSFDWLAPEEKEIMEPIKNDDMKPDLKSSAKRFACLKCDRSFMRQGNWSRHVKTKHNDTNLANNKDKRKRVSHSYNENTEKNGKKYRKTRHEGPKKINVEEETTKLICKFCRFECECTTEFYGHEERAHKKFRPYMCQYCNYRSELEKFMEQHGKKYHGNLPFSTHHQPPKSANEIKMAENEEAKCDESFISIEEGQKVVEKKFESNPLAPEMHPKKEQSQFEGLENHYLDEDAWDVPLFPLMKGIKTYCGQKKGTGTEEVQPKNNSELRLKAHLKTEHGEIVEKNSNKPCGKTCGDCKVKFENEENFYDHEELEHDLIRGFHCKICPYRAFLSSAFNAHLRRKHDVSKKEHDAIKIQN